MVSRESCDTLGCTGLTVWQSKKGYRFSLDPFLLCAFAEQDDVSWKSVADLGCGNGVIPLLLAYYRDAQRVSGFECQPRMVERARRNIAENSFSGVAEIIQADIGNYDFEPESVDAVFTNPPFRKVETGRLAPEGERAAARHELKGTLDDFLRAAQTLLKPGGSFFIVFLAERLTELLRLMVQRNLNPTRLRMVHAHLDSDARIVLVAGIKGGKASLIVEKPLIIYEGEKYSSEIEAIYKRDVRC